MRARAPHALTVALLLLAGLGGCAADSRSMSADVNPDPTFDLWCEDTLCDWSVDAGEIERVPTWHRSDHGTSLKGEHVVLSQRMELGSSEIGYLTLEALTSFAEDVSLFFELDCGDDGEVDYSHPIPRVDWRKVSYPIRLASAFSALRLQVRKEGAGRAVLAQIRVFVAAPPPQAPGP